MNKYKCIKDVSFGAVGGIDPVRYGWRISQKVQNSRKDLNNPSQPMSCLNRIQVRCLEGTQRGNLHIWPLQVEAKLLRMQTDICWVLA